ncbi:hypothetical protein [Crossiella cryophila]|uniref:hypothetical protein n=1 Tax=Crossiella cryophila TaxID=43355 RepID=UPI0031F07351
MLGVLGGYHGHDVVDQVPVVLLPLVRFADDERDLVVLTDQFRGFFVGLALGLGVQIGQCVGGGDGSVGEDAFAVFGAELFGGEGGVLGGGDGVGEVGVELLPGGVVGEGGGDVGLGEEGGGGGELGGGWGWCWAPGPCWARSARRPCCGG